MTASVTSPSGVTELCDIISLDDNHYSIKFVPKEMGVHTVSVKHKDMHIPGKVKGQGHCIMWTHHYLEGGSMFVDIISQTYP